MSGFFETLAALTPLFFADVYVGVTAVGDPISIAMGGGIVLLLVGLFGAMGKGFASAGWFLLPLVSSNLYVALGAVRQGQSDDPLIWFAGFALVQLATIILAVVLARYARWAAACIAMFCLVYAAYASFVFPFTLAGGYI